MRCVISAWRTGLVAAACVLGLLPASQMLAADKPPRRRPVLLPDSEPAGVIVTAPQPFADGWQNTARMPKSFFGGGKSAQSTVKVAVEQGWLQVTRETDQGEREWQIVLAEVVPGDEPPEIEVDAQQDDFRLSYRGGRYCIRETWGELRSVRQRKGTKPWPRLTLPEADEGSRVQTLPPSPNPTFAPDCWWDKRFSNSWIVFSTGPEAGKMDCLVRLNHPVHIEENDVQVVRTNSSVAHAVSGLSHVIDDGEILVALRLGEGDARRLVEERADGEKLLRASAPDLSGARWLNHSGPLAWPDLKGRVVLLDFWSSVKPHSADVLHMPRLRELHTEYAERGLMIIGAFWDRSGEGRELDQFLQDERVRFPMMVDRGETAKRYFVGRRPTYFLVDREGNVAWSGARPPTNEQIEQLLGDGAASSEK